MPSLSLRDIIEARPTAILLRGISEIDKDNKL